ncbi:hypothetical protein ACFY5D_07285 [Paeniglutamicibacter sp. NPDC012692]|uniref:hypothetical protein n=1 Tax=Paeniglutamicibacter sp. NPDC012692 TaxID=3364388 RepID=UPI00368165D9
MEEQRRFVAGAPRRPQRGAGATEYPALRAALQHLQAQDRTGVPDAFPEPRTGPWAEPRPEPRPVARESQSAHCILLTRDAALAQSIALIALGAGVQLVQCRETEQARTHRQETILVGHDCAGEAASFFPGARLVLTGVQEHQDVLWRAAARSPGARVAVLPQAAAWLGEYLGELGLNGGAARITLLAGGCGGAGTSTLAALLAATHTLAGQRTLLIDADRTSTGLWPMLRPREPEGIGWEDLEHSRGALAPGQLAEILPLSQGSAVLSWVRQPGSFVPDESLVVSVLAASRRIYEHIVIDAGRLPAVLPGVLALCGERLLVMPTRCASNRGIPGAAGANWSVVFTGRLEAGTDTRALAHGLGLPLGGYLPRLKPLERAAAEGRLMGVLARTALRRRIASLGAPERAALDRAA